MKRLTIPKAIIALLIACLVFSYPAATSALEKQATGYTVVDRREYPIIFIPGMAGSTLDTADGVNAWPGSLSATDETFKALALKDDGRNPLPPDGKRLLPTGTVRYGLGEMNLATAIAGPAMALALSFIPPLGLVAAYVAPGVVAGDFRFFPIYQGFYEYMDKQGYKLDQTPSVLNQNPSGKVFFDFPYDFRQDNNLWTKALDDKVNKVRSQTKADKVILVGHSMGGLQVRLYMKDPNWARKVAAVVFMGTPHHGSPMPFWAMTEGYNFGNKKLSNARMWEISGNWEGGYQLLPDYPFLLEEKLGMEIRGIDKINTEDWISTQQYNRVEGTSFLQAEKGVKKSDIHYGLPNSDFARKSIDFHKELGNSVDKYPDVKYYGIRGTGQETVVALTYRFGDVGLPKPVLRLSKLVNKDGDGTVPLKGAKIDGLDGEFEVESAHGDIPSNAKAQEILTDLRKKINNEDFRKGLVDKMSSFAKREIASARSPGFNVSDYTNKPGVSFGEVIWLWFRGKPDEAKIKLRDELRGMALAELRNARANITIAAEKEKPEHLYMVIEDYQLKAAGTGVVSGATVNVKVDSYNTFDQVVNNRMSLTEAYRIGKVTVSGTGFSNGLKSIVADWIRKYATPSRT